MAPSTRSAPPAAVATVRALRRSNPYVLVRSAHRRSQVRRHDRSILPDGYERVLHHHVRKTAGTSLNAAFRALGGPEASRPTGEQRRITDDEVGRTSAPTAAGRGPRRRIPGSSVRANGLTFVTGATPRIDEGAYFFANSHTAAYVLHPPRHTFRLTILRNPASRLVSHYRYLRHVRELGLADGPSADELSWADGSFEEFVHAMPQRGRLRQLYMFSETFDVAEAVRRITDLDAVLFTETYPDDLADLAQRLQLPLEVRRERSFAYTTTVPPDEVRAVLPLLADELDLVEQVLGRLGRDPVPVLGSTPG
ncbi:MAG: sulfotransferase family 2 domain-containing protein [Acidimicrobiales bacterium]